MTILKFLSFPQKIIETTPKCPFGMETILHRYKRMKVAVLLMSVKEPPSPSSIECAVCFSLQVTATDVTRVL